MGFFDFFKKGNKQGPATSDNGMAGPFLRVKPTPKSLLP